MGCCWSVQQTIKSMSSEASQQTSMLIKDIPPERHVTFDTHRDKWISHGLWSIVRHPNCLGEILLWAGLFISASSTFTEVHRSLWLNICVKHFCTFLQRWELLSVISPIFVAFLLTFVSGIPRLEKLNDEKWKENPQYRQYMKNTPKLIPYLY